MEWSSRQWLPIPTSSRRFCTTSSAARFSATNSTVFPWKRALVIMLVIVCDFPVPGGPCITKVLPFPDAFTALICEPSAGTVRQSPYGSESSVSSLSAGYGLPSMRQSTTGFSLSLSMLPSRSFHMTNWLNEKTPRAAPSRTSHPSFPSMALRTL